jgi:alkylglycerol monooxygenase
MDSRAIGYAIPVFLVLIAWELGVSIKRGLRNYRFEDALTNLSCGIGQQVVGILIKGSLASGYLWIYDHYRLADWSMSSLWTWGVTFLLVDFLYYWWHRLSHEVNFLWAAHVVHHQSEDYNLAVALRQAYFTQLTSWPFYAILPLIGIPIPVIGIVIAISTLYQFWIHTELIDRMGKFEWLFNAPMHHRVHHAINPQYLDKNYGATFIIWDRLFGSYVEETEPCVYGLVKPLKSYNSIWANLDYWKTLIGYSLRTPLWRDKLRVWVKGPEWQPPGVQTLQAAPVSRETYQKYDPHVSRRVQYYLSLQLVLVVAILTYSLLVGAEMAILVGVSVWIFSAIVTFSAVLEKKSWAWRWEALRWGITLAGLAVVTLGLGLPA